MSIEGALKKDGIKVVERLDTLKVNSIAKSIADKLSSTFSHFGLDREGLFARLCKLEMYYAEMEEGMAEANYFYKNSSIYFNKKINFEDLEEFAVHECIHYLQEVKDNRNNLIRMGLCDYTDIKTTGLALNEASVQLMASKVVGIPYESVKYFGIDFSTSSPSYYPLECCLVEQLAYLAGEDLLFKSTLFSKDDFKNTYSELTSPRAFLTIEKALDDILLKEEKIIKLNNKIANIDDRNKKVDNMIHKINELKDEITITFFRTQNLIIHSFFDAEFERITTSSQIEEYRKKLYSFRDLLGTAEGYTFFDDYYIEKIAALNHRANIIENGGIETAINLPKRQNAFFTLLRKIKELLLGKSENKQEN